MGVGGGTGWLVGWLVGSGIGHIDKTCCTRVEFSPARQGRLVLEYCTDMM